MNDDEFRRVSGDDDDAARLAREGGFDLGALTEGRGTIDTRVVVRVLPSSVVAAMLPAGLQLAPQPLVSPDHHPIFVSFAHNHFSAWFGEMDYHEVLFGIPWVEFAEERMPHRGPFIYMPRLYLDAAIPQLLGERIFGYEKLAGVFDVQDDAWRVHDANGELAVSAEFAGDGDPRAPEDWPHFAWVRKLLEMPTISQALRRFDRDAVVLGDDDQRFVGSTVRYLTAGDDWEGAPVVATVEPLTATMAFGDALTLPAGLPRPPVPSASIASDVLGAFRLRTKQVVSPPGSPFEARYPPGGGRKLRVAVLGGGPAACAAAYYLARQRDAYEVSIYTAGWRLGGKCAAGRNRAAHDRIEEHGLHAFLGFYRNAIRTVGEVYRDAGRPLASDAGPVSGAFRPQANVGVLDRYEGRWTYFPTPIGPNDRVPGRVPPGAAAPPDDGAIPLGAILRRIADELQDAGGGDDDGPLDRVFTLLSAPWREAIASLVAWVEREGAIALERFVETPPSASRTKRWMIAILEQVRSGLAWYYEDRVRSSRTAHFQWGGLDTLLTIARGVLVESTLDFDDLDDRDMVAWLLEHGLAEEHATISTITQVYETLFAHAPDLPYRVADLACGVGLRWFLLVSFGYDGHPAYDFRWSCPETLMTPYYEALRAHGADIHFFHRVEGITLAGHGPDRRLDAVTLRLQATVRGAGPYDPFLADGAAPGAPPAWPLAPNFDQLVEGDVLRDRGIDLEDVYADWPGVGERELRWGRDFDVCILGVPLGALPTIVAPLLDPASPHADPRWQALVEHTALIQTVSTHLWFDRPASTMFDESSAAVERTGRGEPSRGLLTGFVQPVGSLGEMTPLIAAERWPDPPPQLLTYHTGALLAGARPPPPGSAWRDYPAQQREHWRALFHQWLRAHHREIFDAGPADFDAFLDALRIPDGPPRVGLERLWAQAFNVACQPSDLYVLSRPGETKHRLAPSASGVRFLLLAGDWTKTDMNCGCVEAATQSGMLAARALSNEPAYVWRVGY